VPGEVGWRLVEPREVYRAPAIPQDAALPATFEVAPTALTERYGDEDRTSFYDLPRKIELGTIVGAPVHELQIQFLWLLTLPVLLGGVSLMSGAIVIRPMQRGAWKQDAAMVLAAAFTIYTVSTVLDALGSRAVVSPPLTVAAMPGLALAIAVFLIWAKARGGRILPARRGARRHGAPAFALGGSG